MSEQDVLHTAIGVFSLVGIYCIWLMIKYNKDA